MSAATASKPTAFHLNDDSSVKSPLFEAPNSAEVQPVRKHYSIDYSIELERQLEMESTPVTPVKDLTSAAEDTEQKHESLDPEILAHLVMQLRHSLSEITKERDELVKTVAAAINKEASLKDALQLMSEKATTMNEELDAARKQNREDEEAISLLRTKVEESRRGLMRLQTESRRQTMAPIDINRASLLSMSTSPPTNKRASFTPLTGRSHRRISSVSDVGLSLTNIDLMSHQTSPSAQVLSFPDGTISPPSSAASITAIRHPSPSMRPGRHTPPNGTEPSSPTKEDLSQMRKELQRVTKELIAAKSELAEANEAREGAETCAKVLRQFIAENFNESSSAASSELAPAAIKLPPLPSATVDDAESRTPVAPTRTPAAGWGFKLWGGSAENGTATQPPAPATTSKESSNSPNRSRSGSNAQPAPLTKKIGGFFSTRSSVSSTASSSASGPTVVNPATQGPPPSAFNTPAKSRPTSGASFTSLPPLQTNAAGMRRNFSSGTASSDASSTLEPLSPVDDIHGLGDPVYEKVVYATDETGAKHEVKIRNLDLEVEIVR